MALVPVDINSIKLDENMPFQERYVPVDINTITLDGGEGAENATQEISPKRMPFLNSAILGAKKRASGLMETAANIALPISQKAQEYNLGLPSALAPENINNFKSLLAGVQQQYEEKGKNTGLKGLAGEIAGGLVVDPLTLLSGGTLKGALSIGGLSGATAPTGNEKSDLTDNAQNAAIGAGLSGVMGLAGGGISKIFEPVKTKIDDNSARLANFLKEKGIELTAAQRTGSKSLATFESVLENLPFSSGPQRKIYEDQQNKFTQLALKEAGIKAKDASPSVIAAAQKAFGQEYKDLASKNNLLIDQKLFDDLIALTESGQYAVMGKDFQPTVRRVLNQIAEAPLDEDGTTVFLPGTVYHETRKLLGQKAMNADPADRATLKAMQSALDSAFERSLAPADKGKLADINRRYSAFAPIRDTMESSKLNISRDAQIDPLTLFNKVPSRVNNPLETLAEAGNAMLRKTTPDSGTAQRSFFQNLITGGGATGLSTLAAMASAPGSVALPAAAAATALGLPPVAQKIYNSRRVQNYLIKGVPGKETVKWVSAQLPKLAAAGYSQQQIQQVMSLPPAQAVDSIQQMLGEQQ